MDVSLAEMRRLVRDPRVAVLDVRSPEAYTAGHLPGAINIALREMRERVPAELLDRDRPIAVYCGGPS
jgi:rhodanese-related sulfurtransferase